MRILGLLLFSTFAFAGTNAPTIKVLSAGAATTAVRRLAESFYKKYHIGVQMQFDTVGAIKSRLAAGETPDLIIVSDEAEKALRDQGQIDGAAQPLGKVRIGVCAKKGAPKPDLSSPQALKSTLLKAKSVSYMDPAHGATSGIHFAKVLQELGIADEMKSKSVLVPSGSSAQKVASGDAELCVQQVTEILPYESVKLVGLLPEKFQKTTIYSGAVSTKASDPKEARRFLQYLASATGKSEFLKAGFAR